MNQDRIRGLAPGRRKSRRYGAPIGTASPWIRRGGPAVLAVATLLYVAAYAHWPTLPAQVDLQVYRFGAMRAWDGCDLYSVGLTGNRKELLFVYPPFAALCFLPLTFISERAAELVWLPTAGVLLTCAVWRMLRALRVARPGELWSLAALLIGLAAWLEPFRLSLQLGQINIALFALVLVDLLGSAHRKWAGIGIGLATGIKLTPALFIVYLAMIGRRRAALVATATFAATIGVGFALFPADSRYYWLREGFHDVGRISQDPRANTSAAGLLLRLHVPDPLVIGATIALTLAALALAALAHRLGQAVLAAAVVGMASAAAAPFSWSHHWVWFTPLLVHLGYRAYLLGCGYSAWALWLSWALLAGWPTAVRGGTPETGVLSLRPGGMWNDIVPGSYLVVLLATMAATATWLWRSTRPRDGAPSRPGEEAAPAGNPGEILNPATPDPIPGHRGVDPGGHPAGLKATGRSID
ncbi:MAG: glycosyltransferase 87 family protein [Mycobacterium sp.]|uniref:glycosyltransferase 87 family protein n=1 Tax=Mycobacterium sp. TaxID=1785 RepID=UPI00260967FA|nr:glycosyltransferase 87 family protein [Mycobacterium sp.]MDI3315836.1 glycosyltransferase 87 family protein [Mycobacterium sp.]